jgi:hypothetical protein
MRLSFLELPGHERRLYFEQAAARRGLSAVVLEKDFWVCWLLDVLFRSEFRDRLVFKGGTSLSKVFRIIERFSEDIDLSVSPSLLGLPEAGTTRNQADKWMTLAESACTEAVREQFQPALEAEARGVLGRPERGAWFEFAADLTSGSPNLLFHYPTDQPTGFDYLRRAVKLEFGSLTDQQPVGRHRITPWLVDALPDAIPDWQCDVVALGLDRTFWEKATILHAEHHRPAGKATPDRFSRHYADVAALARHPVTERAIVDLDTCARVVGWKRLFFGSAWASYETARPGSFRLLPSYERLPALRRDFTAMRDMYLAEPPSFDAVLATLADLERRLNESANTR